MMASVNPGDVSLSLSIPYSSVSKCQPQQRRQRASLQHDSNWMELSNYPNRLARTGLSILFNCGPNPMFAFFGVTCGSTRLVSWLLLTRPARTRTRPDSKAFPAWNNVSPDGSRSSSTRGDAILITMPMLLVLSPHVSKFLNLVPLRASRVLKECRLVSEARCVWCGLLASPYERSSTGSLISRPFYFCPLVSSSTCRFAAGGVRNN